MVWLTRSSTQPQVPGTVAAPSTDVTGVDTVVRCAVSFGQPVVLVRSYV
jgi:hypothetical protein